MLRLFSVLCAFIMLFHAEAAAKPALYYIPAQHVEASLTVTGAQEDQDGSFPSVTGSFHYDTSTKQLKGLKLAIESSMLRTDSQELTLALLHALKARQHPEITFVQTIPVEIAEETTPLTGKLTARGATKTVEIPAQIDVSRRNIIPMTLEIPIPLPPVKQPDVDQDKKERVLTIRLKLKAIKP